MAIYYNRYNGFEVNGICKPIPGILIPLSDSDLNMVYKLGLSRLDKLSQLYYNNPYSGWLIMQANPGYGGLEFNIPDMSIIRIPFPFEDAVSRYITQVQNNKTLYGE